MSIQVPSLVTVLAPLPDCRQTRGLRHLVDPLLTLVVAAVRCGPPPQVRSPIGPPTPILLCAPASA
jgi:hypothetical protein